MNTIDCIKSRRSVRKFTEEKVPHEVLEQLVELARWAPSWKNTQIARYVAVEDKAADKPHCRRGHHSLERRNH